MVPILSSKETSMEGYNDYIEHNRSSVKSSAAFIYWPPTNKQLNQINYIRNT